MTLRELLVCLFFFFNDTATTEIYTLSLHDALPISARGSASRLGRCRNARHPAAGGGDRKSTRLNSSHSQISYAVFCLKKKKNSKQTTHIILYVSNPTHEMLNTAYHL